MALQLKKKENIFDHIGNFAQAANEATFGNAWKFLGGVFPGAKKVIKSTDVLTGAYDKKSQAIDQFEKQNAARPGGRAQARQMRQNLIDEYSFAGKPMPSGRVDFNLTPEENIKKAAGISLQATSELAPVPIGVAAKGANLLTKVAKGATGGALVSGVGSTGAQLSDKGTVDPLEVAKSAAIGGALGGGIPAVAAGVKKVVAKAPVKAATPAPSVAQKVTPPVVKNTTKPQVSVKPTAERPAGNVQLAIEKAHNAGDAVQEAKLIDQLPEGMRDPMRSALGLPTATKPKFDPITGKVTRVPVGDKPKVVPTSINPADPFGNKKPLVKLRNEAGRLFVDEDAEMLNLLRKVEKETGKTGLVDQWMFDTGNVRASNAIANAKLVRSKDLSGALRGLTKKELDEFDTYAGARAELKNYEGLKTSRTPEKLKQTVEAMSPKYEQRFASLNQYYKNMAKDMYEGGLIDADRYKKYISSDDYVRIQRDMEDLVNPTFGGSRSRSLGTTTATQKRTGSEREILSPTQSVAKRTQQIQLEVQRNEAASNTIDLLQEIGLARPAKNTKNKNTISRLIDGKREIYEVPGDIKRVVDNVSPYQLGIIARIVSAPTRLFRAGTTALSAPFTVTNYLRDQASSAIYSKHALATHDPRNIISGLANASRDFIGKSDDPIWKKFESYVGNQTVYDELRNVADTKRLLREVRLGEKGKLLNMAASPIRTLEDLNSITEKATRFQNFKGIYQKALKETGDEDEAIKLATLAARQNSVDFQRSSQFTRVANLFFPYFNASIQGTRNVARSFRDRPLETSVKSVGLVAIPAVVATAYNLSDPKRREIYDSINDFEKEDNVIIIGPDAQQREDGSWEGVYKIPKPQGYRELTDPSRDVTEAFLKNEPPENVQKIFTDMLGAVTGPVDTQDPGKFASSVTPQIAKPLVQQAANKDFYKGNPIVPEYMEEETDDPTLRARKGTSGSARMIADQLGVSPIQVEKFVEDTAGSLGRYGINAADTALASAGAIPEEQIGGRSVATDFSRRLFEASGQQLERNKTSGQKYFEDVKVAMEGLNPNEVAGFESLHPKKTNFLGEDMFDENKRITNYTKAGIYLNNPGVLEADRKLDRMQRERGRAGNPLFDLPNPLLTKVLLKNALPPGAKDPELSNLYREPWYQDYQNSRSKYYDSIKQSLASEGKKMPKSNNPYPETPPELQKVMDQYSSLPKGTGARSAWIKANPGLFQRMTAQWAQVDAWENKERQAIGLAPIEDEKSTGFASGGSRGGKRGGGSRNAGSEFKYAVSLRSGSSIARPKVSVKKAPKTGKLAAKGGVSKPKVVSRKSSV